LLLWVNANELKWVISRALTQRHVTRQTPVRPINTIGTILARIGRTGMIETLSGGIKCPATQGVVPTETPVNMGAVFFNSVLVPTIALGRRPQ